MSGATVANEATRSRSPEAAASGIVEVIRHRGRSVVTRAYARSPLRLLTPSNHGTAAWIFTSTYGGGLLGGDAVQLTVDVHPGATALMQTQASTKVYRSPRGATSALDARVAAGGRLLVLPDPTVCFAGAAFEQIQRVELQAGASLVLMDWLTAGRRGSGERWLFDRYVSQLTIRYDGHLVLGEALRLTPEEGPLAERMGRFDCVCLIALVGPDVLTPAAVASERVAGLAAPARADLLMSAAPLGRDRDAGCVIRLAGVSVDAVSHMARAYLDFVPGLLGDDPWARKW